METYCGSKDISDRLSSSLQRLPTKNVLRTATLGLRMLYRQLMNPHQLHSRNLNPSTSSNGYKIVDDLAQGTFSTVYICEDIGRPNRKVAMKAINTGCEILARREKLILDRLNYMLQKPLFVQCLDCFHLPDRRMCIILPLYQDTLMSVLKFPHQLEANPGNVHSSISHSSMSDKTHEPWYDKIPIQPSSQTLPSSRKKKPHPKVSFRQEDLLAVKRIAFDLCLALLRLQQEGIIHGDIKPENIFLHDPLASEGDAKSDPLQNRSIHEILTPSTQILLGDFGNAFHAHTESKQFYETFEVQSLPYRAPEVLLGAPFSHSIDLWSLGVVLVELCLRRPWFVCTERKDVLWQIHDEVQPLDHDVLAAFAQGKFVQEAAALLAEPRRPQLQKLPRLVVMKSLTRLFEESLLLHESVSMRDFRLWVDLLAGLLQVNPNVRLSLPEALEHRAFWECGSNERYCIPPRLAKYLYSLPVHPMSTTPLPPPQQRPPTAPNSRTSYPNHNKLSFPSPMSPWPREANRNSHTMDRKPLAAVPPVGTYNTFSTPGVPNTPHFHQPSPSSHTLLNGLPPGLPHSSYQRIPSASTISLSIASASPQSAHSLSTPSSAYRLPTSKRLREDNETSVVDLTHPLLPPATPVAVLNSSTPPVFVGASRGHPMSVPSLDKDDHQDQHRKFVKLTAQSDSQSATQPPPSSASSPAATNSNDHSRMLATPTTVYSAGWRQLVKQNPHATNHPLLADPAAAMRSPPGSNAPASLNRQAK